jgi:peptidylprolyl isomerase
MVEAEKRMASFKIIMTVVVLILIIAGAFMIGKKQSSENKTVVLRTNMGDIKIQLYSDMPVTAGNFEKLVKRGFYNGVIFHRVISGFMVQGGDPTGTGMGGPGYEIKDEFTHKGGNKNSRGTISMANSGPNTGGSQFFINLVDNNFLDGKHPAFGTVMEGMDVVDKIAAVQTDSNDRPAKEVKILSAELL